MTVGIAVDTTDVSSATRNVATNSASVISRRSDTAPKGSSFPHPPDWQFCKTTAGEPCAPRRESLCTRGAKGA